MDHVKPFIRISLIELVGWVICEALAGCHDIIILGTSPIKWRQRPDMTMAVNWDIKHQLKQKFKPGRGWCGVEEETDLRVLINPIKLYKVCL